MDSESPGNRKNYKLDAHPIGSGGFADVHSAKHKPTGDRVAFKKVRKGVRHATERFEREIAVMRQLSHPNIMPLLDADKNGQWYVMPLADESLTNLARLLDEVGLKECFQQVAAGLAHAHACKYVHRDVSPNNILRIRDQEGLRWVIADWGLVRRPPGETGDLVTKAGLGTVGFAAPETWDVGHDADPRADIYSLGRVIAWALTRMVPVPNVDLPAPGKWRALVAKMTAHDRDDRYADMDAVLAGLRAISTSNASVPASTTEDSRAHPFVSTIAKLTSNSGMPVQPLVWHLGATFSPTLANTRSEQHNAIKESLVLQKAEFQRVMRWPRVLRLPDVEAKHLSDGSVVWAHAYRSSGNEVGDEQLLMHRNGTLSFQRATFWDVDVPQLDFSMLSFDCVVFIKLAGRYAGKLGATHLDVDLNVRVPEGANEVRASFNQRPVAAEQPGRVASFRHATARGSVAMVVDVVEKLEGVVVAVKRLVDGVANEFELEPSAVSSGGPPFLAIDSESLAALAGALR